MPVVDVVLVVDDGGIIAAGPADDRPLTPFGRAVLSLRDYLQTGEGSWFKVGEVAEPATSLSRRIRHRGAISIEQAWRNRETGKTVYRHVIAVGDQIVHETYRAFSRRGQ